MVNSFAEASRLRWLTAWRLLAWGLLLLVIVVTLIPPPDGIPPVFRFQDKAAHALAYMVLMGAFGCLSFGRDLLKPTLLLVAVGVLLECAQWFTATRLFELWDMAANVSGVLIGLLLMRTPLRFSYLQVERLLGQQQG